MTNLSTRFCPLAADPLQSLASSVFANGKALFAHASSFSDADPPTRSGLSARCGSARDAGRRPLRRRKSVVASIVLRPAPRILRLARDLSAHCGSALEYALQSICRSPYIDGVDGFTVLAEPTRRRILDQLRLSRIEDHGSGAPEGVDVGGLVSALALPQPTISKHLRVLRDAGAVTVRVLGPRRVYQIASRPFGDVTSWLEPYSACGPTVSTRSSDTLTERTTDATTRRLIIVPDQLPAHPIDAVVVRESGRWVLRMERQFRHSPDRIWAALHPR